MNYVDTTSNIPFEEKVKLYEQVISESYLIADTSSNAINSANLASNSTNNLENLSNSTQADANVSAFFNEKQNFDNSIDKLAFEKDFAQEKVIPFVTEDRNIDLKILSEHLVLTEQELKGLMAYAYPITFYFDFDKSLIKKEEEEKMLTILIFQLNDPKKFINIYCVTGLVKKIFL
jgi:hypothetical protein